MVAPERTSARPATAAISGAVTGQGALGGAGPLSWLVGAAKEALNALMNVVPILVPTGHDNLVPYRGEVVVVARGERAGADAMRELLRDLTVVARPVDRAAERAARQLLAAHELRVGPGGGVVELSFDAAAPGNDWQQRGREGSIVSAYVDGVHAGDTVVVEEHDGRYSVNLGALAEGSHRVELRLARDAMHPGAAAVQLADVRHRELTGDERLVAAHAPLIEGRDLGGPGGTAEAAYGDTPLLMYPTIVANADGTRTITYGILLSHEDSGTAALDLYSSLGRATDYSPAAYSVTLDAGERIVAESYEGVLHKRREFHGEHVGGRAVLRVATANNMLSDRVRGAGTVWSPVPVAGGSGGGARLMAEHPWTFTIMAKELQRKAEAQGRWPRMPGQLGDPREYLHLFGESPLRTALRAGRPVHALLVDGRRIPLRATAPELVAPTTAIRLPEHVHAAMIARLDVAPGEALALGEDWGVRMFDPVTGALAPPRRRRRVGEPAA